MKLACEETRGCRSWLSMSGDREASREGAALRERVCRAERADVDEVALPFFYIKVKNQSTMHFIWEFVEGVQNTWRVAR